MAVRLPVLAEKEFLDRLQLSESSELGSGAVRALIAHYEELRRWAQRLALVGGGEADVIVERHYAESLAAVPLLGAAATLLDLGSGAGFPGCVLAAARPELDVWLVESRARKGAFLRAASAKAKLSCRVVDARVSRRHPVTERVQAASIDVVTVRGVRVDSDIWRGLEPALADGARVLRWEGDGVVEPWPRAEMGRTVELPGRGRKIQEWLCLEEVTQ